MIFIFGQKGGTSWGFQIHKWNLNIRFPTYWKTSGIFYFLIDKSIGEPNPDEDETYDWRGKPLNRKRK